MLSLFASVSCCGPRRRSVSEQGSVTAEIARVGGLYAFQDHSRSLILVPIENPYAISY